MMPAVSGQYKEPRATNLVGRKSEAHSADTQAFRRGQTSGMLH